jgi:hypothetical protein
MVLFEDPIASIVTQGSVCLAEKVDVDIMKENIPLKI